TSRPPRRSASRSRQCCSLAPTRSLSKDLLITYFVADAQDRSWGGKSQRCGSYSWYKRRRERVIHARFWSELDPDCVKTCTHKKSLESYSNTPPNHPRLDT